MEKQYSLKEATEIAHIAVIMGDNEIVNRLYDPSYGYIFITEVIAKWALEFYDKYKDVNWENILEENDGLIFPKHVMCWDDAIIWFVEEKIKEYAKN